MQSFVSTLRFTTRSLSFRGARQSQFQDFSRPLTLGLTLETSVGWHPNWLLFHQLLKAEPGSLEGSHQYTAALLEAVQALREICRQLHEKSQGDLSKYPMAEYNANLKTYEGLMNKCQELGAALNQHLHGESAQPEG
jgi:hypothetical protein